MKKHPFLITADDIGAVSSIDVAVEELVRQSKINNISVFINTEQDISWVKKYIGSVKISLHFTISYGKPVSRAEQVPELVDINGYFRKPKIPKQATREGIEKSIEEYFEYLNRHVSVGQIMTECLEQVEKFRILFGKMPDYVNVHHDLDRVWKVREALRECIPEYKTREMVVQEGNPYYGYYQFYSENNTDQQTYQEILFMMKKMLDIYANGRMPMEVVFHPALYCKELQDFSCYAHAREQEYKALMELDGQYMGTGDFPAHKVKL